MRPRIVIIAVFLISTFLATHCSISDLLPLQGKILFGVMESQRSSDCNCVPDITLVMKTEQIYGCLNFQIKTDMSRSGGQIDLKILGIKSPEGYCLTALGPATARQVLDLPAGTYALNLYYNYAVDRYHLIINADSLQVVSTVSFFSQPEFTVFWRFPPNSFVYLCGTMTETSWICDDFLARLLGEVDLEEFNFPDYGEIPYPRYSEGYYYNAPGRYYSYETEEDFDRAGEILRAYSKDVVSRHEGVSLWLQNWKNKSYRSWLLEYP